jgi:hypothetical protein
MALPSVFEKAPRSPRVIKFFPKGAAGTMQGTKTASDGDLNDGFRRRRLAVLRSVIMSHGDMRFLYALFRGHNAMKRGLWSEALQRFDRAIQLYPLSPGYLVARGHAKRKLGRFCEAEQDFRDAIALGAPQDDLADHIAHCARQGGWYRSPYPDWIVRAIEREPINLLQVGRVSFHQGLVTSEDARAALCAFVGPAAESEALDWLRRYPTLDQLIAHVLDDPRVSLGQSAVEDQEGVL